MGRKTKTVCHTALYALSLGAAFAATTRTYVLLKNEGGKASVVAALGNVKDSQPLFNTLVVDSKNSTSYALVQVTPKSEFEENELGGFEVQGTLLLIAEDEIVTATVRGETVTERITKKIADIPKDFYKPGTIGAAK